MIESMMRSDRRDFLDANPDNNGNGYLQVKSYGNGRVLEFRIPRDRYGNLYCNAFHELLQILPPPGTA